MDNDIIERQGRKYQYCAADDCWYPVPSQDQYDFQRFVLFIGSIIAVCYLAFLIIERIK